MMYLCMWSDWFLSVGRRRSYVASFRSLWPQRRHLRWWSTGAHVPAGRQVAAASTWRLSRLSGITPAQRTVPRRPRRIIPTAATRHSIHHSRMRRWEPFVCCPLQLAIVCLRLRRRWSDRWFKWNHRIVERGQRLVFSARKLLGFELKVRKNTRSA